MAVSNKAKEDFRTPNALRSFDDMNLLILREAFGVRKPSFALFETATIGFYTYGQSTPGIEWYMLTRCWYIHLFDYTNLLTTYARFAPWVNSALALREFFLLNQ